MRFLADENFPIDAVDALRLAGHDITSIRTLAPGISDHDVLKLAQVERRILLTFDKDFGELAFRVGLPSSSGIILFRLKPMSPGEVGQIAVSVLQSRQDWAGHMSVIDEKRIRMTPLRRRRR